jgi:N-acetylglutamate synthase-like GNAT family acetyltransferase
MTSPRKLEADSPVVVPARAEHWPEVEALLQSQGLPLEGVLDHLGSFLVLVDGGSLVGVAGLEAYPPIGLLRSVAVRPSAQKRGLGGLLTAAALEHAQALGIRHVYLLTTTAAPFFERHGFEPVARIALPSELGASQELRGACPASAVAMWRTVEMKTAGK